MTKERWREVLGKGEMRDVNDVCKECKLCGEKKISDRCFHNLCGPIISSVLVQDCTGDGTVLNHSCCRFKVARERVMQTGQQPKWVFYKAFEEMAKEDPSVIIPSVLDSLCNTSSAPSPVPSVRMVASMPTVYITRPVPAVRPSAKKSVPVTVVPPPKRIPPGPFPTALVSNQAIRPGRILGRPPNLNRPQYSTSPAVTRTPGTRGAISDKQKDKKSSTNGVQFSAAGAASQNASTSAGDSEGQREARSLANSLAAIGNLNEQVAAVVDQQRVANSLQQEQNQLLRDLNGLMRQALEKMNK